MFRSIMSPSSYGSRGPRRISVYLTPKIKRYDLQKHRHVFTIGHIVNVPEELTLIKERRCENLKSRKFCSVYKAS